MFVLTFKWYKYYAQMANDVISHNWLNARHRFGLGLGFGLVFMMSSSRVHLRMFVGERMEDITVKLYICQSARDAWMLTLW